MSGQADAERLRAMAERGTTVAMQRLGTALLAIQTGLEKHTLRGDLSQQINMPIDWWRAILAEIAWQPIDLIGPLKDGDSYIVAITGGGEPALVCEATWHVTEAEADWWFANTGPGDYFTDPISQSRKGAVTHFRPMPVFFEG